MLLIVDDSSPDGTAQIVEEMRKEFPTHLHLLIRKSKRWTWQSVYCWF